MANTRFSVPCPSCEATVPIKSADLIGKKTECPKCKYRFVVPDPDGDAAADAAPAKGKKKDAKKGKKAKSGNSTVLIGVGVGVLAVVALVVAAFFLMGDGDKGGGTASNSGSNGSSGRQQTATSGNGGGNTTTGNSATAITEGDPMGGGGSPEAGATEPPAGTQQTKPAAPSGPEKDVTNLLPNETRAVYRVNMDRLGQNASPLYTAVIDTGIKKLVQDSLTIPPDQVATYIHCVLDPDREPFAVVRTKNALDTAQLYRRLQLDKPENPGQVKRDYFIIKSNALIESMSKAFNTRSVLGMIGLPTALADTASPARGSQATPPEKKYALCVYDQQTLLISTEGQLQRYLSDLTESGYPPYKSDLTPNEPPPAPAADPNAPPGGEGGGVPGGPARLQPAGGAGAPGGGGFSVVPGAGAAVPFQQPGVQAGRGASGGQGGRRLPGGAPDAGAGGQRQPGGGQPARVQRRVFTSIPTYRTVDPQLKRMLNDLESNEKEPPVVVYAELLDQRLLTGRPFTQTYKELGPLFTDLASQVRAVGAVLTQFNKDKGIGKLNLEYVNDTDAQRSINQHILPLLNLCKLASDLALNTQTTINNGGGSGSGPDGSGFPGGIGGPGSIGSPDGGDTGAGPGGPGGQGSPGGGGSPGDPRSGGGESRRLPGSGGGVGPPGGRGFPGGPEGFPGGQGGTPGAFGNQATYNVALGDRIVSIDVDVNWPEDKYDKVIQPQVARVGGQIRGRMSVQSGQTDWYTLADVTGKLQRDKKPFPRGTVEREVREERYRLPFPPEQRVSFLADLLPYLGKAGLRSQLQDKKIPWYHKDNLAAAETWVPEFLVPYYPQEAWRAHHPLAEGRTLGATNFVAPAGLGLDAGRYDPANPDHAKKVGITGYDWGSSAADVKDGLSNTIYLIQTPPTMVGPWAAGGGSTVRGVSDTAADPMAEYVHRAPDGRRGTYILMGDGSVRWLKEGTDPAVFRGLVTRAGGEAITDLDKLAPKVKRTAATTDSELRGSVPADRPAPAAGKPAGVVDPAELKKFQGKWKVTFAFMQGTIIPPDALAKLNIAIAFDGATSTATVAGKTETATITALDPTAKPARMTIFDKDKNETETSVYEFVGPDKFKVRAAKQAKDLPGSVTVPPAGTKDVTYFELERVK